MKLVACYVVCNEEQSIVDSLRSLKAYVDEYVIIDSVFTSNPIPATHSTDQTRLVSEIICTPIPLTYIESDKKLTEQQARNLYLSQVKDYDWLVWLDGDEVLYSRHTDMLRIIEDIKANRIVNCISVPTFTTAILFKGLGKDMPPKEFATNPIISTWDYQTKFIQKKPGYQYLDEMDIFEDACYDHDHKLVTNNTRNRMDEIIVINHHAQQSHESYVNDCIWALKQRAGRK